MRRGLPIALSPGQTVFILAAVILFGLVVVALIVVDGLLYRLAALALRIARRPLPSRSPTRVALDELEQRLHSGPR